MVARMAEGALCGAEAHCRQLVLDLRDLMILVVMTKHDRRPRVVAGLECLGLHRRRRRGRDWSDVTRADLRIWRKAVLVGARGSRGYVWRGWIWSEMRTRVSRDFATAMVAMAVVVLLAKDLKGW